ncbi:MAG: hypothetical protein IPK72_17900 [Candidatus Eisenbacteria bacterium]|nr:hypothetical protein [Candidatus Eisenbacteria bacterium]
MTLGLAGVQPRRLVRARSAGVEDVVRRAQQSGWRKRIGGGGEIIPGGDRMPELEFTGPQPGDRLHLGEIVFHRSSEVQFTGGRAGQLRRGAVPGAWRVSSSPIRGDGVARFRVNTSYPGDDPVVITLDPGESAAIPPLLRSDDGAQRLDREPDRRHLRRADVHRRP